MKIKTFVTDNPEKLDKQVNEFEANHNVKFTQTDMCWCSQDGVGCHVFRAAVFYEEATQ
jgi:hypothetical protein